MFVVVMSKAVDLDPALLRRLLRAKDKIGVASHEAWTVLRLSAISGVSPAHFARSFKAAFGVPPHRYLLTRRIERARALRDTDRPIIEIAFQTGWDSLGTFGRTFRDITGSRPTDSGRPRRARPIGSTPSLIALLTPRTAPSSPSQFRRRSGVPWPV